MGKFTTFTSESVCAGHPDKICDSISDAILDKVLRQDPHGKVAIETIATRDKLIIVGEVTANARVNYKKIAQDRIKFLGYDDHKLNFSSKSPIDIYIHEQSLEIAAGVHTQGAGDQGMMYGYACTDTNTYMPLPIAIAHRLAQKIDQIRVAKILPYLKPDGKTQVTVEYKNGKPYRIKQVVVAVPHSKKIKLNQVKNDIYNKVVLPVLQEFEYEIRPDDLLVNGTGIWHISGPTVDSGLTGRKIVVDTYGGYSRVGGGCFSGKDPTKVDRSGAYAARFLAKNIVANKLADKAEVRLAYFIGAKNPIMQEVETFGTEKISHGKIIDYMSTILDTSVKGILDGLGLRAPIYLPTSTYGHFGRVQFPWEKLV